MVGRAREPCLGYITLQLVWGLISACRVHSSVFKVEASDLFGSFLPGSLQNQERGRHLATKALLIETQAWAWPRVEDQQLE